MFDGIIGNDEVKLKLTKAIEDKTLSNTLLFTGPDGIGKSLFALRVAAALMYPKRSDSSILKRIESNNHPDLHVFRPEGKTSMHAIASIRDLIEQVFMAPFEARDKVFIIQEADRMLLYSANALLKTLEEPTLDSYIILISSKPQDLLLTILSRCSRINFSPISTEQIVSFLQKEHDKNLEQAKLIAKYSNGSIALAKEIASNKTYFDKRSLLLKILSKENITSYFQLSDALNQLENLLLEEEEEMNIKWHKEVENISIQIIMWHRDLFLLKSKGDRDLLFFKEEILLLEKQDLTKICSLDKLYLAIDQMQRGLARNIKLSTCLENLFLQINFI